MRRKGVDETALTSPSLARVLKHYRVYVQDCVKAKVEIKSLETFYWASTRSGIMGRSRIYEYYLREYLPDNGNLGGE